VTQRHCTDFHILSVFLHFLSWIQLCGRRYLLSPNLGSQCRREEVKPVHLPSSIVPVDQREKMSARGARSRKVQQKDIDKKEKKLAVKGKVPERHDAYPDWRATPSSDGSRSVGLSRSASNLSQGTSHSGGSGNRKHLTTVYSNDSSSHGRLGKGSTSGAASVSDHSAKGDDKTKFQAHGKETKAPRGRGGGVPVKGTGAPLQSPQSRNESPAPPLPSYRKTWQGFRIWEGNRQEMRPYGGFAFVS
jgi:hypothetical protein